MSFTRIVAVLLTLLSLSHEYPARIQVRHPQRPDSEVTDEDFIRRIDAIANNALKVVPIAGLSVTVVRGSRTIISKGYGLADVTRGVAAAADTQYRIGSITKLITAVAVLKLIEAGHLRLNDKLDQFFPEHHAVKGITIRQLLNHTSAVPDYERDAVARWMAHRLPITKEYIWSVVGRGRALGLTGETWDYTSSNFYLLGLIIEKVSRQPYAVFVEREVLMPQGLKATFMCSGQPPAKGRALDYIVEGDNLVPDTVWELPGIFSDGGMCSTAPELAFFVRALTTSRIISSESLANILRPTVLPSGMRADYGLGVRLGSLDGRRKWGHTGSGAKSNRSALAHYPDERLTVVVLMNTEREDTPISAIDVEAQIARVVLGLSAIAVKEIPLPKSATAYAGIYEQKGGRWQVFLERGALRLKRLGSEASSTTMLYRGSNEVVPYPKYPDYRFVFQLLGGRAIAFSSYDGGWFTGVRRRVE
jgi:D-alanyl-D-alanine carboxypeptidase